MPDACRGTGRRDNPELSTQQQWQMSSRYPHVHCMGDLVRGKQLNVTCHCWDSRLMAGLPFYSSLKKVKHTLHMIQPNPTGPYTVVLYAERQPLRCSAQAKA